MSLPHPWPVSYWMNRGLTGRAKGKDIPRERNIIIKKWRNEGTWNIRAIKEQCENEKWGPFGEVARDEWAGHGICIAECFLEAIGESQKDCRQESNIVRFLIWKEVPSGKV